MKPFEMDISDRKNEYYQFLNSEIWAGISDAIKNRDGKQCRICGCKECLQVHHIRYQNAAGERDWKNLNYMITLCRPCHQIVTETVEKARNIKLDVPAFSVSLATASSDSFAEYIQTKVGRSLYGKQKELVAGALFELYLRSLRDDATPINLGNTEVHRRIAGIVLETLEYQAGWYVGWLNVNTKMETDKMIVQYRADFFNHHRTQGFSDRDIQEFLGLNDGQMIKVRKNAERLSGAGGSG